LGGKSLRKQQLYSLIRDNHDIQLIFVTGRGLETVIPLLNDPIIPNPDFIICDVGATIVNGHTLEAVELLQNDIENKWPGHFKIMECIGQVEGLTYQEVPQQRRCSFHTKNEQVVEKVQKAIETLDCHVIYSAGRFLDILPKGVNKGSTLTRLINLLKEDNNKVLVAGDTLNDASMYKCGFNGVAVGNSEQKLLETISNQPKTYVAKESGAGGILEAIQHFDHLLNYELHSHKEIRHLDHNDTPH
jgi:sucrose-6F-phosphate phosphohydrolase